MTKQQTRPAATEKTARRDKEFAQRQVLELRRMRAAQLRVKRTARKLVRDVVESEQALLQLASQVAASQGYILTGRDDQRALYAENKDLRAKVDTLTKENVNLATLTGAAAR